MSPNSPPRRPRLPRRVRERLADALPGARLRSLRFLGEGWGAVAFHVPAADGEWVLRLPREGVPWALDDLERETRMLPLLASRPFDVAVPRDARLLTDTDGSALGAIHRLVPGTPLGEVRTPRGRARTDLLAGIGRFIGTLHATPPDEARRYGVEGRDLWTELYVPRIEQTLTLLGREARAWLEARAEAFVQQGHHCVRHPVLVHGDISGDHLLVGEDGRLSGVIDFAEARISDPAIDLAGVLNRLSWRGLEGVLAHYERRDDEGLIERVRFYIDVAPIYSVTDGYVALGEAERRRGLRRLAARATAAARNRSRPAGV